ncbi:MAG: alpha/beta hydrolase, partial [Calditrichaeota bacterium]|nr:alpha/beta hydrolase [Calditrichota bacterium]
GGGNGPRTNLILLEMAPFFAKHGIASVVYDKRANGKSGGEINESRFDKLIVDAVNVAEFLKHNNTNISKTLIALGFSQGGDLHQ